MKVLIKQAKIYNSISEYHLQTKDILVEDGLIKQISDNIEEEVNHRLEGDDLCVSAGWFDPNVQFCDPGYEYNEDLNSGLKAAMNGGFTAVGVMPNTMPVMDSKSQVEYLINRSKDALVDVYPIGALSEKAEGKNITEMYDMSLSGAIAFSDGQKPIQNSNLLKKALLYTQRFNGIVSVYSEDTDIAQDGYVNESPATMNLGLKVRPALAETIQVKRNIELLRYTGGRLHLSCISTKGSIEAIREAKKDGLNISADASINNIAFDDSALQDFDTNFKVLPVLREKSDREALIAAVEDGTIDFVTSNHTPLDGEYKAVEFDNASFGASGIETLFANLLASGMAEETAYKVMSEKGRLIYGLKVPEVSENQEVNLTVFSKNDVWVVNNNTLSSKSVNTPVVGKNLKGRVLSVLNKSKVFVNN